MADRIIGKSPDLAAPYDAATNSRAGHALAVAHARIKLLEEENERLKRLMQDQNEMLARAMLLIEQCRDIDAALRLP